MDTECDLFTKHGLHMNLKGKEHIAYKIIKMIKVMLNKIKSAPIEMKYTDDLERINNEQRGRPSLWKQKLVRIIKKMKGNPTLRQKTNQRAH